SSDDIATKRFFQDLIRLVIQRDRTITRLRDGPRPVTDEALTVLRIHVKKYIVLLDQLRVTNRALSTYIEALQTTNAFPSSDSPRAYKREPATSKRKASAKAS